MFSVSFKDVLSLAASNITASLFFCFGLACLVSWHFLPNAGSMKDVILVVGCLSFSLFVQRLYVWLDKKYLYVALSITPEPHIIEISTPEGDVVYSISGLLRIVNNSKEDLFIMDVRVNNPKCCSQNFTLEAIRYDDVPLKERGGRSLRPTKLANFSYSVTCINTEGKADDWSITLIDNLKRKYKVSIPKDKLRYPQLSQ